MQKGEYLGGADMQEQRTKEEENAINYATSIK